MTPNANATLWEVEISVRPGRPDAESLKVADALRILAPLVRQKFSRDLPAPRVTRGLLVSTSASRDQVEAACRRSLVDPVVEDLSIRQALEATVPASSVTVLRKPGVMDPVAMSAQKSLAEEGCHATDVRTFRRCDFGSDASAGMIELAARKALANEAIERIVSGPWPADVMSLGGSYEFVKVTVPMRSLDDAGLEKLSKDGQLYLNIHEMRSIQAHFDRLGRDPTDVELETIAQTWSEHCSHKTLRGPYEFNGRRSNGLLKDTIFHVTRQLAKEWCVSVFADNAGIVKFDDEWNVCFKVETHNHPSAIEPYGGSNTGLGGVIRDILGAGLGAKPICNTDVFCVAPPDTRQSDLPDGVLHPERVLRGVVAGVRDYGNRMGIPTVNGAIVCDPRYLGNPLVFCGTVGLIPADQSFGKANPGDLIVALGGRTGRDGIHGATFSSGELTHESETVSGGAVQIGNAIEEKRVSDVVLRARDMRLFSAITDCGAGGFSSAVGEMGADIGATVKLESAPLKYSGLSYTEIWISEAQERMVLAVPPANWPALKALADGEEVEAFILGTFEPTRQLTLTYEGRKVGELDMHFLHEGRPPVLRRGDFPIRPADPHSLPAGRSVDLGKTLHAILGSWNVASKEWIIRQYDHEVQGGSIVKPLVGVRDDGPSDAAVVTPVLGSHKGIAVGCGLQIRFGDLDPYRMAASAIDEAMRNVVAVGGDPNLTSLLDNFCWGNTARPETFGSLCHAAMACRDVALTLGTPFISGKDSLNNEFDANGEKIVIPPTLLISALSIVPDVRRSVTMDLKEAGNRLLIVGITRCELGGSHFNLVTGATGGEVPTVDAAYAAKEFASVHHAIAAGLVRSCHDLSEGGLAVALAEMAFAGGLGAQVDIADLPTDGTLEDFEALYSESNSRFVLEVLPQNVTAVKAILGDTAHAEVGDVVADSRLTVRRGDAELVSESLDQLRSSWQKPFHW